MIVGEKRGDSNVVTFSIRSQSSENLEMELVMKLSNVNNSFEPIVESVFFQMSRQLFMKATVDLKLKSIVYGL